MTTSCKEKNEEITLSLVTTPMSENDYTSKISYTVDSCDECFLKSPAELSDTLAKTAIVLSSSAYNVNVTNSNLKNLGFSQTENFNYDINYDEKAVGITFGVKVINDIPVIAIILRGTLSREWYSNFDIGQNVEKTLVHKGFDDASRYAFEKLYEYEEKIKVDSRNCKYFVTGHSRGGAVANLLSKKLIDIYGSESVYAYTFAAPNTTLDKNVHNSTYSGIFNFVNSEDFIAFVPLESWGFQKYGTTKYLLTDITDEKYEEKLEKVKTKYKKYRNRELKTYGGTKKLEEFLKNAHKLAPTVKDYYHKKHEILGDEMSLYDFMETIAQLLNQEDLISNGLLILNCDDTDFKQIKDFMMIGMEEEPSLFMDYDSSLISYTHSAESYLCYLEVFLEEM